MAEAAVLRGGNVRAFVWSMPVLSCCCAAAARYRPWTQARPEHLTLANLWPVPATARTPSFSSLSYLRRLIQLRRVKVCKTDGLAVLQMVWVCHRCRLAQDLNFVGL